MGFHITKKLCLTLLLNAITSLCLSSDVVGFSNQTLKVEDGYVTADDGVKLYYQKVGRGRQTIISPGRLFLMEDFKTLGDSFTLISYDMRNRGRSDTVANNEKLTIQDDVKDLEAVRRHFKVSKFHAVGYSYLGLMVVMYSMDHPQNVDRIVQLGPIPMKFGTEYPAQLMNRDKLSDIGADPAALAELQKLFESGYSKTKPKEYCEKEWHVLRFRLVGNPANVGRLGPGLCDMPNEWPINLARHFQYAFESVKTLDIPKDRVRKVTQPVLTIHGTKDRNAVYGAGREWAMTLPNARLLTVEGAAHQLFAEFPDIVFPAIRTFLSGSWPKGVEKVTALTPRASN